MTFHQPGSSLYIPDPQGVQLALSRTTHLGVGAHQDDLEFMAFHGIQACYRRKDAWFGGVTCTNGSGSARSGAYASCSDAEMMAIRRDEQNQSASLGEFSFMAHLDYPSPALRGQKTPDLDEDLRTLLSASSPRFLYTHNPADKHNTHIGVFCSLLRAARSLPPDQRPEKVFGCEVWRGLDWMPDEDKVAHDITSHEELAKALNEVFQSQIAGGKHYDLAISGRRRANATFFDSHSVDNAQSISFAMDLTPLFHSDHLDPADYVLEFIDRFRSDVETHLRSCF